jgi:fluoride exporter
VSAARSRPGDRPEPRPHAGEPVDPDVDLHVAAQRDEWRRHRVVLPVIAAGGMAGASARHAVDVLWPPASGGLPAGTLGVNALGCLLIGVLMVYVVEVGEAHPLVRPFLGVGVLGGFTTFSTYSVEVTGLLADGHAVRALAYLGGTVVVALAATLVGLSLARRVVRARRLRSEPEHALRSGDT